MEYSQLTPQEFIESVFRIRKEDGTLIDYKLYPSHKKLLNTGILGDRSIMYRLINKGRRIGMTVFLIIEKITIALKFPGTKQYYVATNEDQAKEMISRTRDIIRDARVLEDGTPLIKESGRESSLKIVFEHPNGLKSEIIGYASSPSGLRGKGSINVFIDEYDWMTKTKNLQKEIYDAMKYFVADGSGMITINSTPSSYYSIFMKYFRMAEEGSIDFVPLYFPLLTSYRSIYKPLVSDNWKAYENDDDYVIKDVENNRKMAFQKIVCPYPWISIRFLEKARKEDVELFKREVLGQPSRKSRQFISKELLDSICLGKEHKTDEVCKIGIDVAKINDITAITVGYMDNNDRIVECKIEETQLPFPQQWERIIKPLLYEYNVDEILVDDTGGSGLSDNIEKDYPDLVTRICFSNVININDRKVRMNIFLSENLRSVMESGKYIMIDDDVAREHCMNVERILMTNTFSYSGKRSGRDDHFFSKSLLAYGFRNNEVEFIPTTTITNTGSRLNMEKMGYASWM